MQNAQSYNFGISIAKGMARELVRTSVEAVSLVGSIYALINASNKFDETLQRNNLAMGGYTNTLKAMQVTADKIASGKAPFDQDSLMDGARQLQRAGIDVKKNFDLVSQSAQAAGQDFSTMANTIRTGNFSALADAGLITDRMAISMERYGYTAQQASQKIVSILNQAKGKGMFDNLVLSLPQILQRFSQFGKELLRSIMGDPKDPNGFMYGIKSGLTSIANFMYNNLEKIRKFGAVIGTVLRFTINVVGDFLKRVGKSISSVMSNNDKFWDNFQEKIHSFQLWLAIAQAKIKYFFDQYGGYIMTFLKIYLAFKAVSMAGNWLRTSITAVNDFAISLQKIPFRFSSFINLGPRFMVMARNMKRAFLSLTEGALEFAAAMLVNPLTWIAVAVVAIVALIVYWDQFRAKVADMSNGVQALISIFMPIIGIIILIAQNWTNVKTIFINLYNTIRNKVILWKMMFLDFISNVKSWFHDLVKNFDSWMTKMFGIFYTIPRAIVGAIVKIFDFLWDKVLAVYNKIAGVFKNIKGWFSDLFSSGATESEKMANNSAEAARNYAKAHGYSQTGIDGGVNKTEMAKKQYESDIAKGISPEDAKKAIAPGSGFVPTTTPTASLPDFKQPTNMGISTDDFQMASKKIINVNQGAIQINASNLSTEQLKNLIRQVLAEPTNKYK